MLISSEFTSFLSNLIRCQDNLEGNRYLPLLSQLIKINIAGEYEGNVFYPGGLQCQ